MIKMTKIKCRDCSFWSGSPGNNPTDVICAVNLPMPELPELERVDGRKASALHCCPDFQKKLGQEV